MRRFFNSRLGRILTAPFRAAWWLIALPFRALRGIYRFFTAEPTSQPIGDILASIAEHQETRTALLQNIVALRGHIIRSVVWWFLATAAALVYGRDLILLMIGPLNNVSGLDTSVLTTIDVTESITVLMRLGLMAGFIISFPLIAFEIWYFIAPGLKPREKMYSIFGIPLATILFIVGVWFCYAILLPSGLSAIHFMNDYYDFNTQWRPDSYFRFATGLLFWMGITFEFPIVVWILSAIGLVSPKLLLNYWRIAVVFISVFAAMITPTVDPFTMGLVMAPMIVLYFLGILLSVITYRKRRVASA